MVTLFTKGKSEGKYELRTALPPQPQLLKMVTGGLKGTTP